MPHDYVETKTELPREGARVAWPWRGGEIQGVYLNGNFVLREIFVCTPFVLYPERWRYLKPDEL